MNLVEESLAAISNRAIDHVEVRFVAVVGGDTTDIDDDGGGGSAVQVELGLN